jgi:hypothetical protein
LKEGREREIEKTKKKKTWRDFSGLLLASEKGVMKVRDVRLL